VLVEGGAHTPGTVWLLLSCHESTVGPRGTEGALPGPPQDPAHVTESLEEFLQHLVGIAATAVGGDVSAGVTVVRDGHPAIVVSSDARAAQCDEVHAGLDEGPCLTAMRAGAPVLMDDLAADERNTPYRRHALGLGVRSSLSLPLAGGDHAVGVLNLYSGRAHFFGPVQLAEAARFADEISRGLHLMVRVARHVEITDQLRAALTSRTVIDQAIGIIMGQNRCDGSAAFDLLRSASQHRNAELRTVAMEIITAVGRKPPSLRSFQD
jgi:hypothetical protein